MAVGFLSRIWRRVWRWLNPIAEWLEEEVAPFVRWALPIIKKVDEENPDLDGDAKRELVVRALFKIAAEQGLKGNLTVILTAIQLAYALYKKVKK